MPGFKDKLSDTGIWTVLSYIESTWPADIRERQKRMSQSTN
jgi:mono/diheme cytochrome c family protein